MALTWATAPTVHVSHGRTFYLITASGAPAAVETIPFLPEAGRFLRIDIEPDSGTVNPVIGPQNPPAATDVDAVWSLGGAAAVARATNIDFVGSTQRLLTQLVTGTTIDVRLIVQLGLAT